MRLESIQKAWELSVNHSKELNRINSSQNILVRSTCHGFGLKDRE